jgi:hypothetical protein
VPVRPGGSVGGGNSAGQAAVFLADTSQVYLLVRGTENMSGYLVDQVERHPSIEALRCTEVRELVGRKTLEAVVVENNQTGELRKLPARAFFVFIGASPHTTWLSGTVRWTKMALCSPAPMPTSSASRTCGVTCRVRRWCWKPADQACSRPGTSAEARSNEWPRRSVKAPWRSALYTSICSNSLKH